MGSLSLTPHSPFSRLLYIPPNRSDSAMQGSFTHCLMESLVKMFIMFHAAKTSSNSPLNISVLLPKIPHLTLQFISLFPLPSHNLATPSHQNNQPTTKPLMFFKPAIFQHKHSFLQNKSPIIFVMFCFELPQASYLTSHFISYR